MKPFGVIEGFYGHPWSYQARHDFAAFAQQQSLDFYLFAPKSAAFLRKAWRQPWPDEELKQLKDLRQKFALHQVGFGVGFSPFGAAEALTGTDKKALEQDIELALQYLNALELDYLCILFDDMPVHLADLAQRQLALIEQIKQLSNARHFIVCPSFYSFDPRLEEVFGKRSANYWQDLGSGLDSRIDCFWTGDHVCSRKYLTPGLSQINELLQRQVFIWDNYPVNDGRLSSPFLHLSPSPAWHDELGEQISGLAANPMNMPLLSRLPLLAMASCFKHRQSLNFEQCLERLVKDVKFAQQLSSDRIDFEQSGLQQLPKSNADYLLRYSNFDHPMADEICDWLQGHYKFDPECLTD